MQHIISRPGTFQDHKRELTRRLLATIPFHTGEWQSMDTRDYPTHATHELMDVSFEMVRLPQSREGLVEEVNPDLPWADEHFAERVSGEPLNPPPSHVNWPYAVGGNSLHLTDEKFDHTYPERFWPKQAGRGETWSLALGEGLPGIRFNYGDYQDVVNLLTKKPYTRQAFLPIWFPEDTGATHGQRVPCTLGYHFMIRNHRLSMRYYMRSCDILRHFTNDVYFAVRLMQHTVTLLNADRTQPHEWLKIDSMTMHIANLHAFVGDGYKLREIIDDQQ